jgi:hypothetical protein
MANSSFKGTLKSTRTKAFKPLKLKLENLLIMPLSLSMERILKDDTIDKAPN